MTRAKAGSRNIAEIYRAPGKSLYMVARNFCLALPGSSLAKQTYFFGGTV